MFGLRATVSTCLSSIAAHARRSSRALRWFFAFFSFVSAAACGADNPADSSWMFHGRWSQLAEPVFQNFGPESQQVQATVYALAQDPDGFIWIGTEWGLSRWDGYRSRLYAANVQDPHALHNSYVDCLFVSSDGTLWIGTRGGGLARYDRDNDRFINYPIGPTGFPYPTVTAIAEDAAGNILVATGSGEGSGQLDALDPKTKRITTLLSGNGDQGILLDGRVRSLLRDRDGTLWVGTLSGLLKREKDATSFTEISLRRNRPEKFRVYALHETFDRTLWIGTNQQGVFFLEQGAAEPEPLHDALLSNSVVKDLLSPVSGELWIATAGHGVAVVDTKSLDVRWIAHESKRPTSLRDNLLFKLLLDHSGFVWIGSASGVGIYNPQAALLTVFGDAEEKNGLPSRFYTVLFPTTDGNVWMGTAENGVDIVNPATNRAKNIRIDAFGSGEIGGLGEADKKVFVASHQGLYRSDLDGHDIKTFSLAPRRPLAPINNLWMDGDVVWLQGFDGLWKLPTNDVQHGTIERAQFSDRLSDQVQTVAARSSPTRLWIGTEDGLNRVDTDTDSVLVLKPDPANDASLSSSMISTILLDHEHRLWVGTPAGIDLLANPNDSAPPRFRHFTTINGVPSATISLLQANDGKIWATTTTGLIVIDPAMNTTRHLQLADGVATHFNVDNAGCVTPEGELLFGGIEGVTVARPELLKSADYLPPVVVTDMRVGNTVIQRGKYLTKNSSSDPVVITPGAGSLSVEFASLDFAAPNKNRYAYRLDGYDRDWNERDFLGRTAHYTDLPPGDCRLQLRGTNHDGRWSNSEPIIAVRVLPPWYRTAWAYVGYVLLLGMSLWLAGSWRVRRMERATRILEKTVASRTAELAQANAQLEAATQAKSAFLANMSHEIRTPMNAVLGFAQLGQRQSLPPKARDYFSKIVAAGKNLLGILNDILDFSKIESGRLELEHVQFRLRAMLEQVRDLFAMKAAEQSLEFSVTCADDVPDELVGDPLRLSQVLINLIGNALKFTHRGFVRVDVTSKFDDDAVQLHVSVNDSGIGMDETQRSRLFVPFSQADSSTTRLYGGTGLGLTISQRIVEHMGGRIDVQSQPNIGSVFAFEVRLDRAREPVASETISHADNDVTISGARVLLAEDNPVNQELAREIIGSAGATVVVAASGEEAVRLATTEPFDCVLMDIQMPGLDGFAATALIRANTPFGKVPIVAMTAHAGASYRNECLARGMDDYITKPIDASTLIDTIARWSGKQLTTTTSVVSTAKVETWPGVDRNDALARFNGNEALLHRLLQLFVSEFADAPKQLSSIVATKDFAAASRLAHSLGGAAGNISAHRLHDAARNLEDAFDRRDTDSASSMLVEFDAAFDEVLATARRFA